MEYRDTLVRYVGRRICVSTFGHVKLWGELATVNDDSLRLVNTVTAGEGEDQWLTQSQYADPDSSYGLRHAETIVHFHHIVAITCLDDDLPPIHDDAFFGAGDAGDNGGFRVASRTSAPPRTPLDDVFLSDSVFQHLRSERLEISIGSDLVKLAKPGVVGGLAERVTNVRNIIGLQLGFVLPPARVRDDLRLDSREYRIFVNGSEVARGSLRPEKVLAIDGGKGQGVLEGEKTIDPAFGQPAVWIEASSRENAERAGYFVVESAAVLATHLQREVRRRAGELLTVDGLRMVLEYLKQTSPVIVEELVPGRLSLTKLHDILACLLEEEVPLRPLERVLEHISHLNGLAEETEDILTPLRVLLGRMLCERHRDQQGVLHVFTLDRETQSRFQRILLETPTADDPIWLQRAIDGLHAWFVEHRTPARDLPLVVDTPLRRRLWQLFSHQVPGLSVLSFSEVPRDLPVNLVASLGNPELGIRSPRPRKKTRAARRRVDPAAPPPTTSR